MNLSAINEMNFYRRLFRFGLRSFFVGFTASALWFGIWTNAANRQRRAVETIGRSGHVTYFHEFPFTDGNGAVDYATPPPGPKWLRRIIGNDYFQTVRIVCFAPDDVTMKALSVLRRVDHVDIDAQKLTDDGLSELSTIPTLKRLAISRGHNLTSNGMEVFRSLPNLEWIHIESTPITEDALQHLYDLENLRQLTFSATKLEQSDLVRIKEALPNTLIFIVDPNEKYRVPTGPTQPHFLKNDELAARRTE